MLKGALAKAFAALAVTLVVVGCSGNPDAPQVMDKTLALDTDYRIGPGDQLQIFVWRNSELSTTVRVRPDGRISVPLIEDLEVAGKTPTEAGRLIEGKLSVFVKDAVVTVIMVDFIGPVERQIRVVGEAAKPLSTSYHKGVTVMDVMIQAGGLTLYASGNSALIVRVVNGTPTTYRVRLDDLMKKGDMSANVEMAPGDILMIPQSWF